MHKNAKRLAPEQEIAMTTVAPQQELIEELYQARLAAADLTKSQTQLKRAVERKKAKLFAKHEQNPRATVKLIDSLTLLNKDVSEGVDALDKMEHKLAGAVAYVQKLEETLEHCDAG